MGIWRYRYRVRESKHPQIGGEKKIQTIGSIIFGIGLLIVLMCIRELAIKHWNNRIEFRNNKSMALRRYIVHKMNHTIKNDRLHNINNRHFRK